MIAVIDYGAGNLSSVAKAIARIGHEPRITSSPEDVLKAEAVVLPGVGAAADAVDLLQQRGLVEPIARTLKEDRPFLGICLGYQLLFTSTEEGNARCLGLLPGRVLKLPGKLKVPHMGWNQVWQRGKHPVFEGIPDTADFYFVHSYYPAPDEPAIVAGETEYGVTFASAIARGRVVATQFHPEKSGEIGLRLLANFFRFAGLKS
jgi:imidazole glycerol-phosphate synthase subunit HisH